MVQPHDEDLHPIGREEHWQESWYFNWADTRHPILGLTRIGLRFHQKRIDGLVLSIENGEPRYIYPAVSIEQDGPWTAQSAAGGIRAGSLVYQMEEPLRCWRLRLFGRGSMDLLWTGFTPVYDYAGGGSELPPNVAAAHYEQSGRVTGWTSFRGRDVEILGSGQRDHSWGARDWARVEGWNWVSAQFEESFSFNVWEGFHEGKRYVNGFVFRDGTNHPVEALAVRFEWAAREHVVGKAELEITERSGKRHRVAAEALGRFPLVKSGLWIDEVHAKFSTEGNHGRARTGIGVIEHAWHAGALGALARAGDLLRTLRRVYLTK